MHSVEFAEKYNIKKNIIRSRFVYFGPQLILYLRKIPRIEGGLRTESKNIMEGMETERHKKPECARGKQQSS